MAFDGIVIANLTHDFKLSLLGSHINKISQPEDDELQIIFKTDSGNKTILLSANPSVPIAYFTENKKAAPLTAPNFCMMLRKHIQGGLVADISQPSLERIIDFTIEHRDELGDKVKRHLIAEFMGRYSNIILTDDAGTVLDSIKHVTHLMSSVREVYPGKQYFIPAQEGKHNPLTDCESFNALVFSKAESVSHAISASYTGISYPMANEFCHRAGVDGDAACASLDAEEKMRLAEVFARAMEDVRSGSFTPNIIYEGDKPAEFASLKLTSYPDARKAFPSSVSEMLYNFYSEKSVYARMRQKTADLRHVTSTLIDRTRRKYDLQSAQLRDTDKMDKFRQRGELLFAYGHAVPAGAKSFECEDYNTGKTVKIKLNPDLSAQENAKVFFEKYSKLKRTREALSTLIEETRSSLEHLESIDTEISLARTEADLSEIKEEMAQSGYIKSHGKKAKKAKKSEPYHFISSDGFDIYVGKNNYQNDYLTFKIADGGDWWFHAKKMPGSHVVLRCGQREVPDRAFEEAAGAAAYFSKGQGSDKVEVDYLKRKDVKKPNGAKPGYVIYYTNFSMAVKPGISSLTQA